MTVLGSGARPGLAAMVLAHGGRLDGTAVADLRRPVEDLAGRLIAAGVVPGSVVAVPETDGQQFFVGVLAAWSADAVPMPFRPGTEPLWGPNSYRLRATGRIERPAVRDLREVAVVAETTAVLHTTSGSTGVPKLARRGCLSVLTEAAGYRSGLGLGPDDSVYVPVPLSHSYGWGVAVAALLAGCELDVRPLVHARRAAVRTEAATVAALTAPIARLLAAAPASDPGFDPGSDRGSDLEPGRGSDRGSDQGSASRLRIAMVGAGRVTAELDDQFLARFGVRLARNYGSSETGATFLGRAGLPAGCIGQPMDGVAVVEPSRGGDGELCLRIDAAVEGHAGSPEPPQTVWRTGDIVRRAADDIVTFVARRRPALRVNDRNVDAAGLERALRRVADVDDVLPLVLSRTDGTSEDLYVLVAGGAVDPDALERQRPTFPESARSARIVLCDRLPVLASGKVDRAGAAGLVRARWTVR